MINEKINRDLCDGLRNLLAIERENPRFQLWDINGKNIGTVLKSLLSPRLTALDNFHVA